MMYELNSHKTVFIRLFLAIAATTVLHACGGGAAPLDADTRAAIDSTATAQISKARMELDSICLVEERTKMPQLVDSIKKIRLREIEEQLKLIPK